MTFFFLPFFYCLCLYMHLHIEQKKTTRRSQMMRNRWRVWDILSWDYILECSILLFLFIHERQSRHLSDGFSCFINLLRFSLLLNRNVSFLRCCHNVSSIRPSYKRRWRVTSFLFKIIIIDSIFFLFTRMNNTRYKRNYI